MSKSEPQDELGDADHVGWYEDEEPTAGKLIELDTQPESPKVPHVEDPSSRIVRTEITHYVQIDAAGDQIREQLRRPGSVGESDEGLTPGLIAMGLLFFATLLGFGWYLGTRSAHDRATAVAAELTDTERQIDNFERDSVVELAGEAPDGTKWSAIGTPFVLESGLATIATAGAGEVGITLVETGWSDGTVGATVATTSAGTGIVFRFIDIFNHWSLIAAPEFGTWNLNLVVEGETIRSESIGLASTEPGARVSILLRGPEIRIFVNGAPTIVVADPTFELATSSGLISVASTGGAFDEYYAIHDASSPVGG